MTIIKKMVEAIEEELEGAKDYAEKYVECKAKEKMQKASRYKEMAEDELKHAMYVHEWAVREVEQISTVYIPPADMMEKWEKAHREYVEKVAWVRQMLAM
jgi:intergrase/recombinase